ncbi:MAG TPA: serine hydrolase domain-containing protein [Sphingobacteriaceae bacterium]
MKKILFLLISILIHTGTQQILFAQNDDARIKNIKAALPVIDKIFKNHSVQNPLPGLVYGLVVDGKLIHTGNMGYLNTTQKTPAGSKSAFRIASMTKSFTAMAIVKLRDEGKLRLDDPVDMYIPEIKGQKYLTTDAPVITIRHLLTHTAGFPEDNPWGDRQLDVTDEELINLIKNGISFSNVPGLTYEYSNLGFATLGYIIKKVSGQSYQTYITEKILEPLGMTHTWWEYTKVPAKDLAHGYRWLNDKWVEEPLLHDGAYGAMGGMITTMEDFSKYVSLHLSAWPARNDTDNGPVKRSSLREMHFPWSMNGFYPQYKFPGGRNCSLASAYGYGLGWSKDCRERIYIGHSGGLPGFGSNWKIVPDYGIGIISFSNRTYAPTNNLNLQVLDTLIAMAKLKPRKLPVSDILNQRKAELIRLLPEWKDAENANLFAENFFMDYSIDFLIKETKILFKQAGKIIHIRELIPENNLRGSFIMEGEHKDIEISFTLTPENPPLIQEYRIKSREKSK